LHLDDAQNVAPLPIREPTAKPVPVESSEDEIFRTREEAARFRLFESG